MTPLADRSHMAAAIRGAPEAVRRQERLLAAPPED
jgi:hypothetical protein